MLAAEQLNVSLAQSESAMLSEEARRLRLSISAHARNKLLAPPLTDADRVLIEGLSTLRPYLEEARRSINTNIAAIVKMRKKTQALKTKAPDLSDVSQDELKVIADNLGFLK